MTDPGRIWHEIGTRSDEPAVAGERLAVVAVVLGDHVAEADVDLRSAQDASPATDDVRAALDALRGRRRNRWSHHVRVRVAELGRSVDDPTSAPDVRAAWHDVRNAAGYVDLTLVGGDGSLLGAVHDGLVTAALTSREVGAVGARLGLEPVEIVSQPTGLGALLQTRPRGSEPRR
jgi:hypothetical protein